MVPYPIQPEIPPSGGDQRKKSLKQAAKDVTKAQSAKTQIPEVVINVQDIEVRMYHIDINHKNNIMCFDNLKQTSIV